MRISMSQFANVLCGKNYTCDPGDIGGFCVGKKKKMDHLMCECFLRGRPFILSKRSRSLEKIKFLVSVMKMTEYKRTRDLW